MSEALEVYPQLKLKLFVDDKSFLSVEKSPGSANSAEGGKQTHKCDTSSKVSVIFDLQWERRKQQAYSLCERNVRCGFRLHPSIAQPEAAVLIAPFL